MLQMMQRMNAARKQSSDYDNLGDSMLTLDEAGTGRSGWKYHPAPPRPAGRVALRRRPRPGRRAPDAVRARERVAQAPPARLGAPLRGDRIYFSGAHFPLGRFEVETIPADPPPRPAGDPPPQALGMSHKWSRTCLETSEGVCCSRRGGGSWTQH